MRQRILYVFGLFVLITLLFFYPIFKGNIPFPGDLLIGEYPPYNSYPYHGYEPASYPNKGQNFDVIRLIYPAKLFSIEQLKNGEIPLWNPYIFAGNPHIASLQSGTFYPLNILFFLFPFNFAWAIYIIIQPILAAFFTYLFLRKLKLSLLAAIFGGVVFAFSSYFTVWIEYGNLNHVFLWLPLILYVILSALNSPRFYKYILLVVLLSLTILAGYAQTAIYVFVFSFIFFLYCLFINKEKKKVWKILLFGVIFTLPVAVCAVQLLPLAELFFQSTRTEYSTKEFLKTLVPFFHAVTFLVPDFFGNPATRNYFVNGTYIERVLYVGVIPAFLALYLVLVRGNKMIWFFLGSAVVVFLLVYNTLVSQTLYSIYLPPIISTGVPSRMMFLFVFPLSVLSAFGFESLATKIQIKKVAIAAGVFALLFISFWGYSLFGGTFLHGIDSSTLNITKRNLIIPSALLILGLGVVGILIFVKKSKEVVLVCLILLTIADLFYFFKKITPFAPIDALYPRTAVMENLRKAQDENRSWGYGEGRIDTNLQVVEDIYGADGYDALHIKRFAEFLSLSENGTISKKLLRSDSELPRGFGNEDLKMNQNRKRVMDILGIKYILNKVHEKPEAPNEIIFSPLDYRMVWNDERWQIYENKKSLPRVYLAGNIFVESNDDVIAKKLMDNNFDLRTSAIVEKNTLQIDFDVDSLSTATISSYLPTRVIVKTRAKTDTLLVLTDNYYTGWKAYVDGKETQIYRTNYTFRGVVVPKGSHTIEYSYSPSSFIIGKAVSIGTTVLLVGSLVVSLFVIKDRRRKQK